MLNSGQRRYLELKVAPALQQLTLHLQRMKRKEDSRQGTNLAKVVSGAT